jgi:type VI secretion system protein ImpA
MLDIEELVKSLSDDEPAGKDLEYDPLYLTMDGLAAAVPDSYMGDSKIEGHGPDWKTLTKNCLELWTRTRDLRVAVYLTIARAITGGLEGLAEGLKLPLFLVKDLWEAFYPRLDPDDGNDPLERLNILSMLSPPAGSVNDPVMFIPRFRETRLVPSLRYTLRDLLIAINDIEAASGDNIDEKLLRAEFLSVPPAEIERQSALATEIKTLITGLCDDANSKMSDGSILDMSALVHEIDHLINFYDSFKTASASQAAVSEETETAEDVQGTARPVAAPTSNLSLLSYQAGSRTEALLLLKKGAEYFQREEPNSPIPQLVNRALRFSEMSFIELVEDIMPDALSRGLDILGIKPEAK